MKVLKVFILAIAALFVSGQFQVQAQTEMKECTESWLQRAGGGPGTPPPGEDPGTGLTGTGDPANDPSTIVPIYDGVYVLLALAGAYVLVRNRKKALVKS